MLQFGSAGVLSPDFRAVFAVQVGASPGLLTCLANLYRSMEFASARPPPAPQLRQVTFLQDSRTGPGFLFVHITDLENGPDMRSRSYVEENAPLFWAGIYRRFGVV